jgi:apolipoprotein D and lipocalin family protein
MGRRKAPSVAFAAAAAAGVAFAWRAVKRARERDGQAADEPTAVTEFDVERYLGRWYQIAAVPRFFQAQCWKNARADYALSASGDVEVRNSCVTWIHTTSSIQGRARALDSGRARFNVSFLRGSDGYRHTDRANYVVVGLDEQYGWAVVTDSRRSSGFVLSRTVTMSGPQREGALRAVRDAGLDPRSFRVTRQDGGETPAGAFG